MTWFQNLRNMHAAPALVACALLAVPWLAAAGGEGDQPLPPVSAAPPAITERGIAECHDLGEVAGQVASVSGPAFAQAPGEDPRALACDDVVRACDRITTGDGGTVALLISDVWVGIESGSDVTIQSAGPDLHIALGSLRVIDTRRDDDGGPFAVSSAHLGSRGHGADAEFTVGLSGAIERTRLCSHGDPITVSGTRDGVRSVGGGTCVAARGGALFADGTQAPQIVVPDGLECFPRFAGPIGDRFAPGLDVGPQIAQNFFPPVTQAGPPGRSPCDDPGSGCTRRPAPPVSAIIFRDPNPATGCGAPGIPCP